MESHTDNTRDLVILEEIEQNPDSTQASLANRMGVAVGTINWHLKRLIAKGYVKVRRAERRKLRYIITPEGITLRTHLTVDYIQTSFRLYRATRERVLTLLEQAHQAGYDKIYLLGEGDVADVCRLTCLEQNFTLADAAGPRIATLEVHGMKVLLKIEEP
jgi:DNA-binding MarR family transcriptional regulator